MSINHSMVTRPFQERVGSWNETTLRSILFKGNDLEKFAKFKDRKITPHAQVEQRYIPCARSERASTRSACKLRCSCARTIDALARERAHGIIMLHHLRMRRKRKI